jgi:hypothetical protein
MAAGSCARACAQPRRTVAGDTTAAGVSYADYSLFYPLHLRRMHIFGSAGSRLIPAVLPPLATWPWRCAPLKWRSHGRTYARSGCTCPAGSRGGGGTSIGSRRTENRRLAQRICSGGATWTLVRNPLAPSSYSPADACPRREDLNPPKS